MTTLRMLTWHCIALSMYMIPTSMSLQSYLKPMSIYKSLQPPINSFIKINFVRTQIHKNPIILYSTSSGSSSSYNSNNSNNSTRMEISEESESLTTFSDKPPRRGPIEKLKRFLFLLTSTMTIIFKKIIPSSGNKTVNSAFDTSRKRRGTFEKLIQLLYLQLTSRRFWIQMIFLFSSFSIFSKILRFSRSLVTEVSYSSFMKLVSSSPQRISDLKVTPSQFSFLLDGRSSFTRPVPLAPSMVDLLVSKGLDFYSPASTLNFVGLVTTLLYFFFLWKLNARSMGPPDEAVGQRKDGRLQEYGDLSFNDIAGQERAKQEVSEICEMLRDPKKYSSVGARLPSGVLLVGPPGTGKTLLARVTAAEARVPFYSCSASDFVEVFVGRGPARVRKLFKQAAENAPSIIFIDELDSLGRSRRMGSMNSEQESTLNQLLTAMDGLDTSNNGVIVMAATNRAELLDPALLRAGRFDRIVQCPLPDRLGRLSILEVHTRRLMLSADVDLDRVSRLTPNTCGADLATIVNEAAIRTARRGGQMISAADFDDALRQFFSGRGVSVAGLTELVGASMPAWLKQLSGNGASEPQPGFS